MKDITNKRLLLILTLVSDLDMLEPSILTYKILKK